MPESNDHRMDSEWYVTKTKEIIDYAVGKLTIDKSGCVIDVAWKSVIKSTEIGDDVDNEDRVIVPVVRIQYGHD